MQQPLDLQQLEERFQVLRQSEFFPAIMGAVAGGLTGALMAGLIAGRRGPSEVVVEKSGPADKGVVLGFSAKDLLQLATIVAALARQLREFRDQQQA